LRDDVSSKYEEPKPISRVAVAHAAKLPERKLRAAAGARISTRRAVDSLAEIRRRARRTLEWVYGSISLSCGPRKNNLWVSDRPRRFDHLRTF
jgi:hypothetical protein